jgi:tetratricopeptide (TPR) repeat protein
VIDEAKKRLKPIAAGLDDTAYEAFAIESLKTIDCVLVSHGFVYPGIGLVQLLSDGLDPTMFSDPMYYRALLIHRHNLGRTNFIEQRKPGPYYVVDCDIASYMYLAVAEIMKYPLAMVQMPLHNFIRWLRPSGGYIDFETMDGRETDDGYYQALWGIPQKFLGTLGVLTTMNTPQLLAYEHFGVAISFTWKKDFPHAIAEYEKAISVDASLGDSANNLAWLYAVVPDATYRDGPKAVVYGQEAVAIFPNGDWLDTLACAFGTAGDFPKGVEAENRAIQAAWAPQGSNLEGDLAFLSDKHPCSDPTFGVDAHPFRPSHPTPRKFLNKDANAVH